ncbi:MAG TPA: signal recognition particle protein [Candidatus Desulfofervidus auxilii]|uniref:Signal recognition particle protein n=1 Tax=Desulfofervidus auxilii TaxID=1621989 RepID=A0A7C0Y9W3_DESA2|nr:signal recognition particle protein [Candidatus Desulfofervidus auxilii]
MFENLSEKLNAIFKKLKGHGRLTEEHINQALREVKLALLEADVNYKVVKDFLNQVKEKALGQEVMQSLTPAQQVIKIVKDELTTLMGGSGAELNLKGMPAIIMLVGLQGSGKTTTCAKLAKFLKEKRGRRPYLVSADIYRPAAIEQLNKLGEQINIDVHPIEDSKTPLDICLDAVIKARKKGYDTILIDTAGRLHIDEKMMDELKQLKSQIMPQEILLVADAMTGQDAVNIAKSFNEALDISGVILTKMEGDARGGAALSIKAVTQKPIKFIGVGEKLDALEIFYPDRIASRILGMGDILSFIEKAQETIDLEKAKELEKKLRKSEFTLEDFREQLQRIRKMGSLEQILSMLPGFNQLKQLKNLQIDEKELIKIEAIINSMTKEERLHPEIINGSRRRRIARGSGTTVQDVNRLLKQYAQTKKMIKTFTKMGKKGKRLNLMNFFS